MAIYSGFSHQKCWFSIVMLVYHRVLYEPAILIISSYLGVQSRLQMDITNHGYNSHKLGFLTAIQKYGETSLSSLELHFQVDSFMILILFHIQRTHFPNCRCWKTAISPGPERSSWEKQPFWMEAPGLGGWEILHQFEGCGKDPMILWFQHVSTILLVVDFWKIHSHVLFGLVNWLLGSPKWGIDHTHFQEWTIRFGGWCVFQCIQCGLPSGKLT